MEKRQLGRTELYTAPIVVGGNVFGWTLDEEDSFKILDECLEKGFNTIDTANSYSHWAEGNKGGESESIIGTWMKKRGTRKKIDLITKVGSAMGQGEKDISEKQILQEVDNSLKRLKTDVIDLYLTHWDDEKTPVEETLRAYQKLVEAGKIRYIGASNLTPERLTASLQASETYGLPRYEVFQPGYNLYDRQEFEKGVASTCKAEGLGVITYYSLASGFLTGKYKTEKDLDKSVRGQGVRKYLGHRGKKILKTLEEVAEKYKVSQAAIALAWLIHSPLVTAPIASATKKTHIKAFVEAAGVELSSDDMKALEEASAY